MTMPGRTYTNGSQYRYGFNGKENDKDIDGNNYDYGFRIYNPQLGKFLSVDPLTKSYPWNSTYAYAENDVSI
jgi:RHS repeat-associated protein